MKAKEILFKISLKFTIAYLGLISAFWLIYGMGNSAKNWRYGVSYLLIAALAFWACWLVYRKTAILISFTAVTVVSILTLFFSSEQYKYWQFEKNPQYCGVFFIIILASVASILSLFSLVTLKIDTTQLKCK